MSQRFEVRRTAPDAYKAMQGLYSYVADCGLEHSLLELLKIRASQINGCAFCIAMHVAAARRLGVTDDKMHLLCAWREASLYTPRERAALAWTEALTRLTDGTVTDALYADVRKHFSEKEVVDLAYAVVEITGWNRLMIGSGTPPQHLGAA